MKQLLKRSLSLLLALVMILGMLPANVLTVHAEETTDDPHSLKYADGIVWLVKSKTGSYSKAFEDKIANGELADMIRDSVPGTNGSEVVKYDGVDISNMMQVALMGKLEALKDGLVAAVTNHELVTFNIGGVDRKIAFRNVLTVNINIPDVVIESIGEPADLHEQVANAINNPNITISHIDEISIEKAGALIDKRGLDSYSWPNPGDEDVEVGWITVRIYADDVTPDNWMNYPDDYPSEEAFLADGCKVVVGKVILRESRDLFTVSITSNGEVLYNGQIPEFDPMPQVTVSEREYYTFTGWEVVDADGNKTELKAEEGKTPGELLPEKVLMGATYTAQWNPDLDITGPNGEPDGIADQEQEFTVTFTDGVADKEIFADEVSTLLWGTETPVPTHERTYYEFLGWQKNGEGEPGAADATVTNHVTYTAIWAPINDNAPNGEPDGVADEEQSFNIIFNDGAADKVFTEMVYTLLYGSKTSEVVPVAEREYYDFLGWLKNGSEVAGEVDENVTDHATYTAKWKAQIDEANGDGIADQEQKFTVTYTDGADGKVFADVKYNLLWGSDTPVYEPTRTYYTFEGWDKTVAEKVTDDVIYTAQWKPINDKAPNGGDGIADEEQTFTITYTDGVQDKVIFEDVVHVVAYGKTTPFYQPEREFYTFMGWSPEVSANVKDNATYVARWKPNRDVNKNDIADEEETFTVTFKDGANGEFFADKVFTVKWGEATPTNDVVLGDVARAQYYYFGGWSTDVSWKVTNDATYVANTWTPKVDNNGNNKADQEEFFKITFIVDRNGEEEVFYTTEQAQGGFVTPVPPTTPEYSGQSFVGWQDENGKYSTTVTVSADATYYAVFTNNFMVTYIIEYWNDDEPTVFVMPATADARAEKYELPERDGEKLTDWHLEGSTETFDFATVLTGNVTLYARYDSIYGAEDKPFLRYIFMHKNGTVMEERSSYKYEEDESPVSHPDSDDDDVVFTGWTETVTKTEENGVYTETHVFTPNFADDRNNNGKPDEGEKLYHYVFADSVNVDIPESLDKFPGQNDPLPEGWLGYEVIMDGDSIPDGYKYINLVTLAPGEVFVKWDGLPEISVDKDVLLIRYPNKMLDRNSNGYEDGSTNDPYVYYVVKIGDQVVCDQDWLAGEPIVKPESYNDQVALGENQKILKWERTETTREDGYTQYTYTPVVITDRNGNNVDDGSEKDPYVYYVVKDREGNDLYNNDWLAGEDEVNPADYNGQITLNTHEKILGWNKEAGLRGEYVEYTYTPNVITDRNNNLKHDGSVDDPYTYYVYQYGDVILYNDNWLAGEAKPNGEIYKQKVLDMLVEHQRFMNWSTEFDQEANKWTFSANVITDRNMNDKHDGSAEDPYTYYVYIDHNGVKVLNENRLASEGEILPENVECTIDTGKFEVFKGWGEPVTEDLGNGNVRLTYTANVIVDRNGNGADDELEADKIQIPTETLAKFEGFSVKSDAVAIVFSGEKDGETYTGTVTVTDANGKSILTAEGTFTYDDNTVIKATPLWNADQTKMIGYVAGIKVNGEELLPYYANYMASNKPMAEVAVMMMAAPIAEEDGHTLEVIYEPVVMTEKDPHDTIELGKTSYTEQEIYNAMISTPTWDADELDEFITVEYKARNASKDGQTIPLTYVYSKVPGNLVDTAKSMIGDSVPVSWSESWKSVGENVAVETVDSIVIDFVDKLWAEYDNNPTANDLMQIALKIKNELPKAVAARAGYHAFATNPEGRSTNENGFEVIPEDVRITYKDPQGRYFVELSTTAKLEETRKDTYITVPTDKDLVTFVYGEFTSEQLLDLVALYDEDGKPVSGELKLDHYAYHANGVKEEGYTVTVSYGGNELYKDCSNTFTIYITKATPKITIENIDVKQGEVYDPAPVVVPEAAEIVHVIAGIELSQLNIDLITGVVTNKNAGNLPVQAWIDLPFLYEDIIRTLGFDNNFYTMAEVKEKISGSDQLVKQLQPALDQIDGMMDEIEAMIVEKLGVTVEFTMMISFQDRGKPTESGFYLNYAQIMDTANYNEATAFGTLMITPMYAMPNSGVELVYKDFDDNQNLFVFENDGTEKALKVVHEGKYVDAEIKYYGLTTRADVTDAVPEEPGVYVVTAIYTNTEDDGSITLVGSDVALAFINMTRATIEVDNMSVVYDGSTSWYPEIVIKDESGKNIGGGMTVISGTVMDDEDGKAVALEDITGNVNIDFPTDLDNAWKKFCDVMKVDISSKEIHPSDVVEFLGWYNAQIDDKAKTVTDLLAKLTVNEETTQKALDMAKAASNALKVEVEKLPDNVSVSFYNENELKYIETGAYLFVGVITDPELIPDVNAGLVVVKSADAFEMYDTYVPYNGEERNITVDDTTSRDNVTLIVDRDHNQVNFILDETMFNLVNAAMKKAGYEVYEGSDVVAEAAYMKGNAVADTLTNVIIDYIEQTATDKIKNKFPASSDELDHAMEAMKARLGNLQTKLSTRLQEIDKINDETIIALNGKLPVDAGDYQFYGFDYDVAYTSATLHIEPIHIVLDVNESAKVYKEENPKFTFESSYYSYEGVAPSNKSEVTVELPANVKLDDLIGYSFKCAADVNSVPGEYDITLSASLEDTSGNYVLDTETDVDTLYINPLGIIVTATVEHKTIKVGDKATVTVEVTDTKGNKLDVEGDFDFGETTGLERDDFVLTAVEEGEYTIVPSAVDPEGYYDVTQVNPATLTVDNVDVTITAYVNGKSSATITYGEIPDIKVVAKGSDGKDYIDLLEAKWTITDAAGNKADENKLAVGHYTITPSFTAAEGYNVDDETGLVSATLEVKPIEITVAAKLAKDEVIVHAATADEVGLTTEVTDANGNLITVDGLLTGTYKFITGYNLDKALHMVGSHTIIPVYNELPGYKVNVEKATLTVCEVPVNGYVIDLSISDDNVGLNTAAEPKIDMVVKLDGETLDAIDADYKTLNPVVQLVKNGKTFTLNEALAELGEYTITATYNDSVDYTVTVNEATLRVVNPQLTIQFNSNVYSVLVDYEVTAFAEMLENSWDINDNVSAPGTKLKEKYGISYVIKNSDGNVVTLAYALSTPGEYEIEPQMTETFGGETVIICSKLKVTKKQITIKPVLKLDGNTVSGSIEYGTPGTFTVEFGEPDYTLGWDDKVEQAAALAQLGKLGHTHKLNGEVTEVGDVLKTYGLHTFIATAENTFPEDSDYEVIFGDATLNVVSVDAAAKFNPTVGGNSVFTRKQTVTIIGTNGTYVQAEAYNVSYGTDAEAIFDSLNLHLHDDHNNPVPDDAISHLEVTRLDQKQVALMSLRSARTTNLWDSLNKITDVGVYEVTTKISEEFLEKNPQYSDIAEATAYLVVEPVDVKVYATVKERNVTTAATAEDVGLDFVVKDSKNKVIDDHGVTVEYEITDSNGNEFDTLADALKVEDTYTITPVVKTATNQNYNVLTEVGTVTLTVDDIDVKITVTLSKDSVRIIDNENVTVTIESSVAVNGLLDGYTIDGIDNLEGDEALKAALQKAGTYTIQPKYKDVPGYDVTSVDTAILEVKNAQAVVTPVLTPDAVYIPDNTPVELTYQVKIDGVEVANHGLTINDPAVSGVAGVNDLATALKTEGNYTIIARVEPKHGYTITPGNATLEVKKAATTITVTVGKSEFTYGEVKSIDELNITVTADDDRLDKIGYIIKDSEGNVVTPDFAINNAGEYFIHPNTSAFDDAYEVTYTPVKFTVKPIDITVEVVVGDNEIYVDGYTTVDVKAYGTDGKEVSVDGLTYKITDAEGNEVSAADAFAKAGTYTITHVLNNGNYNVTSVPVTLTVSKREITVAAVLDQSYIMKATSTQLANDDRYVVHVSYIVKDSDGNEYQADSEIYEAVFEGMNTITESNGNEIELSAAQQVVGAYTVTPELKITENDKYVVKAESATLRVVNFDVKMVTLSLDGVFYMNYYLNAYEGFPEDFDFEGKVGVLVWKDNTTAPLDRFEMYVGSQKCDPKPMSYSAENNAWRGTSNAIYAKNLYDTQYFRPYVEIADGVYVYGSGTPMSSANYCYAVINDKDRTYSLEEKELCASILDYGTAAQLYFDYYDTELINKNLPANKETVYNLAFDADTMARPAEAPSAKMAATLTAEKKHISTVAYTIYLHDAIQINFGYLIDGLDIEKIREMKLLIWEKSDYQREEAKMNTDGTGTLAHDANTYTYAVNLKLGTVDGVTCYKASSELFAAKEFGKDIYFYPVVVMETGETYRGGFTSFSPQHYIYMLQNDADEEVANLVKTLAVYGDKAIKYSNYINK